ncbi:TM0106 family RecB-like putative nuclease [Pseudohalioglobus lutimaris]|uniref:Helicase n=1 Tax=Pseudohalioglobus lutimaris TaxID=1737061 RepID=A0A2N5WXE4_9GAMM|nr:TM0106 family RecB-like putative nuclease [Pseudohalioglobus lutimaris]PLW66912.1 helicase [Pseudohalioglobus lutimaris]
MKRDLITSELVCSPSDLTRYIDSPFASWMARHRLEVPDSGIEKDPEDPLLAHLAGKGLEHEANFLETLKSRYSDVITINDDLDDVAKLDQTRAAMAQGADVIFQACLEKRPFRGYADFLIKVDQPSELGGHAYVAWDTKLAKEMKPYFVIQLCCYSEMLEAMQGWLPDTATVVLGTNEEVDFTLGDYYRYYQAKKSEFVEQQAQFDADVMPDPFQYAQHGEWTEYVENLRQQKDHLSRVANITRNQISKLEAAGISTLSGLAATSVERVPKLHEEIFATLKSQAAIQLRSEKAGTTEWEIRSANGPKRNGLAGLPPANAADLFWDLEGFPLEEGGLEYLWGCAFLDDRGERSFWERWAHDHTQEMRAFTDFIQWAYQRWLDNPGMHIYHYGHYEVSACKRLMGRYGVCEFEVDQLLRHGVFIDLYRVVLQGLVVGEPGYSIKNIEHLYRGKRETDVATGGESVVVYAQWREAPDGDDWKSSEVLNGIRQYNIDDCNSTLELADWLRSTQIEAGIEYQPLDGAEDPPVEPEPTELELLEKALLTVADSESETEEDRFLAKQLAHLVLFHTRENKPVWWRYFERSGMSFNELYDDPDCLAGCRRTDREPFLKSERARNLTYEYRFDTNQEFRNRRFKSVHILNIEDKSASVHLVDSEAGILQLTRKYEPPEVIDVIAYDFVSPGSIDKAIQAIGEQFLQNRQLNKPLKEFLLRQLPDVDPQLLLAVETKSDGEKLDQIIEVVAKLDDSIVTVQGPPGTGKTYTASHVIHWLLKNGKSVGVTSNSHKAIDNLLIATYLLCSEAGDDFPFTKVQPEESDIFDKYPWSHIKSSREIWGGLAEDGCVIGATAWGFSTSGAEVDYLFVDEAGQVSLAKLAAMSTQARSIVCLGDQMQLPQPIQVTHPGDSACSILDYFLQDTPTVPPEKGVFLNRTYRMHKGVNGFISDAIYSGRLGNDPACDCQEIQLAGSRRESVGAGTGIRYLETAHSGNKQASQEEVDLIAPIVESLHESSWVDKKGIQKPLTPEDILVVAPFNYQVNELKKRVGNLARVGTVDLFQGQEAPVVIVSMTASVAADSARGVNFLLNKNRLNVAISRAKALAIVVASNTLLEGNPAKLQDMRVYNLFNRLKNYPALDQ